MVRAIGELYVDEEREFHCVWCGDEIEHEGVVRTTDSMPSCGECLSEKPWQSDEDTWDRPLDDTMTPIRGERDDEDFFERGDERKP